MLIRMKISDNRTMMQCRLVMTAESLQNRTQNDAEGSHSATQQLMLLIVRYTETKQARMILG